MSSYVSLNNASLTGANPGNNYSNTKYYITSDYFIYLRPIDFEKVAVKTNEVTTSTAKLLQVLKRPEEQLLI